MADDKGLSPNPVIDRALKRWQLANTAESEIRENGLECDRFYMGEQWPDDAENNRLINRQPCLVINQLKKFVRQVTNDSRQNRPSVKVVPVSDADEETAKILEGMVRNIQVSSNADIAYDTACESQVVKGWGYFRVITEYEDDKSFNQVIKIKRIKNPYTVYVDPNAIEPDYSDAKWYFIVEDMPKDEFKKLYPKAQTNDTTFTGTGNALKSWQDNDTIRVAEYFECDDKYETLCMMTDGKTALKKDLPDYDELKNQGHIKLERETCLKRILWRKITQNEILEGGEEGKEWPGKYMPIIPVLGDDIDIDGKRYLQGMVCDAIDPQRQVNYMSSALIEALMSAPKAPWLVAEGQIEGYEDLYRDANVQALSVLPYKPISLNGQMLPPPQRNTVEPPVQAIAHALAQGNEDLKGVTGIFDAGLGQRSSAVSGKAITALQKGGDMATFNYIDNLARSITYLGKVVLDLIPIVYDAPRVLQIVGEDDSIETVHVNTPLDNQGKPIQDPLQQSMAKIYDLSGSVNKYDVQVVVGPSYATKRQEAADSMMQLVGADPEIAGKAGDIIVKAMDFPLHSELSDRLKKFLPPGIADDDKGDLPPQAKAQMQQMQQMIQQQSDAIHKLMDEKEQKTAELDSKERISALNNETQIAIEAMKQENAGNMAILSNTMQNILAELSHQRGMEAAEHAQSIAPQPQQGVDVQQQ